MQVGDRTRKRTHRALGAAALLGILAASVVSAQASQAKTAQPTAASQQAWQASIAQVPHRSTGCFTASYPRKTWHRVQCAPSPDYPQPPRNGSGTMVIGNTNDVAAQVPSGYISHAIGSFDNVTNVTSESGPRGNSGPSIANAYTLQLNTNFFTSTACAGSPNSNCQGWEQFVYENYGSGGQAYMQYWLLRYNASCPSGAGWHQFSFTGSSDIYCWKNNSLGTVPVPNQPVTNLQNLSLSGVANSSGDSVTMFVGSTAYSVTGDNAVNAGSGWNTAEFNVFGDGGNSSGGGMASFNSGASLSVRIRTIYSGGLTAPSCVVTGFTAETNNLSFSYPPPIPSLPGPALEFNEDTTGGAPSNCTAATPVSGI